MRSLSISILTIYALLLHGISVVLASSSFISIRTGNYSADLDSAADIIDYATTEDPIVVFQFHNFKLLEALADSDSLSSESFLNTFFYDKVTREISDDVKLRVPSDETLLINIDDNLGDATDLLYDSPLSADRAIWLSFTDDKYELNVLNEFTEFTVDFLGEYLKNGFNVVINTPDSMTLESFYERRPQIADDEASSITSSTVRATSTGKTDDEDDDDDVEDPNVLSKRWTHGLLMCFLVSIILLVILIWAIKWTMSIEISYGALEKSTNPLKKNQ